MCGGAPTGEPKPLCNGLPVAPNLANGCAELLVGVFTLEATRTLEGDLPLASDGKSEAILDKLRNLPRLPPPMLDNESLSSTGSEVGRLMLVSPRSSRSHAPLARETSTPLWSLSQQGQRAIFTLKTSCDQQVDTSHFQAQASQLSHKQDSPFLTLRVLEPKIRGQPLQCWTLSLQQLCSERTAHQRTWHILDALFPQLLHLGAFHTRRFSSMRPKLAKFSGSTKLHGHKTNQHHFT